MLQGIVFFLPQTLQLVSIIINTLHALLVEESTHQLILTLASEVLSWCQHDIIKALARDILIIIFVHAIIQTNFLAISQKIHSLWVYQHLVMRLW